MYRMDVPFRAVERMRYALRAWISATSGGRSVRSAPPVTCGSAVGGRPRFHPGGESAAVTRRGSRAEELRLPSRTAGGAPGVRGCRGRSGTPAEIKVGLCQNSSQTLLPAYPRYERL